MDRFLHAALALMVVTSTTAAESKTIDLTVAAGKFDRVNEPVCVILSLSPEQAGQSPILKDSFGKPIPAQLTAPGLLASPFVKDVARELHFILPSLKAGESAKLQLSFGPPPPKAHVGFRWDEKPGMYSELYFADRPVLRYVCPTFDDSTKEKRERTFKVFHHLYDPTGKRLVTNDGPPSLYPHHRGIFYGFNKITYGKDLEKKADIWHCTGDTHMTHEKTLGTEAGPVLGRHRVKIAWHGEKKEVFATEERELTVYNVPGGQLVEFASRVRSTGAPIKFDGDPQHAGFHFRADKEVADKAVAAKTIFVRPDGEGKPGETRNWDPKTVQGPVNLPWNAMSFVLSEKRYTVAYLDKPTNPKEARFSERDYGRIGSYFVDEIKGKETLAVNYRLWLQEGLMKPEEVAAKSAAFVTPVAVTEK